MTTLIEVAVYAAVMAHGTPLACSASDDSHVSCTNGITAVLADHDVIRYSSGVTVQRDKDGFPHFSDGTKSWFNAMAWLAFSNGVQVRRLGPDLYRFSTGIACRSELPALVDCAADKNG